MIDRDYFLKAIEEEIDKCVKCGACRDVCPVFFSENTEVTSPRGKNSLLVHFIDSDLDATDIDKLLNSCTLCEACLDACPKDIATFNNVLYGRIVIRENSKINNLLNKPFGSNAVMSAGSKLLSLLQNIVFNKEDDLYRLKWRIGDISEKSLPKIPGQSFFSWYNAVEEKQKQFDKKVLFFVGCLIRYLYPDTGIHLVEILNKFGWGVIVPQQQGCCGLPAVSSGDIGDFTVSMDNNIAVFSDYPDIEYILSACGSCGNTLQHYYPKFSEQSSSYNSEQIEKFSGKIKDFSEFLLDIAGLSMRALKKSDYSVTYHDSCHLNRGMNVKDAPRQLLQNSSDFKDMNDADACCGFGGTFSIKEYDSSQKILTRKMENVKEAGTDYLTTGCPGCVLQLTEGNSRYLKDEVEVIHIVDYLYKIIFS